MIKRWIELLIQEGISTIVETINKYGCLQSVQGKKWNGQQLVNWWSWMNGLMPCPMSALFKREDPCFVALTDQKGKAVCAKCVYIYKALTDVQFKKSLLYMRLPEWRWRRTKIESNLIEFFLSLSTNVSRPIYREGYANIKNFFDVVGMSVLFQHGSICCWWLRLGFLMCMDRSIRHGDAK